MVATAENFNVGLEGKLIELKLFMNIEIIRSSSTNFIFFVSIGYPRWPLSDKLNILLNIFLCIYFLLIHISNDILHRVTSLLIFSTDQSKTLGRRRRRPYLGGKGSTFVILFWKTALPLGRPSDGLSMCSVDISTWLCVL